MFGVLLETVPRRPFGVVSRGWKGRLHMSLTRAVRIAMAMDGLDLFCANFGFLALQEPSNIGVVTGPNEHGQKD